MKSLNVKLWHGILLESLCWQTQKEMEKVQKKNWKNQTVLWIRLAYGVENCSISVSMALTMGSNTKMEYNVFNHSVVNCTKGYIRISVIMESCCYLWSFNSKGCEVAEFVIHVYSAKIYIWKTMIILRLDSQNIIHQLKYEFDNSPFKVEWLLQIPP